MAEPVETRKCRKCEKEYPENNFTKRFKARGPWMQSYCKSCSLDIKQKKREERKVRPVPASLYHGLKFCRGHNKEEPKAGFGFNKTNTDFLDNYCKEYRSETYRVKKIEKRRKQKEPGPENPAI